MREEVGVPLHRPEGGHAAVARHGGHATLLRAPDATRLAVPVFEPQSESLAALARRVKYAFDPRRVLNPGRMAADL